MCVSLRRGFNDGFIVSRLVSAMIQVVIGEILGDGYRDKVLPLDFSGKLVLGVLLGRQGRVRRGRRDDP